MTEFEKKLRAMRIAGDTEHMPEGFPTFDSLDEISQKILFARLKSKAFDEASPTDMVLCVVAEMSEKYNMTPVDQVYLLECIKGFMGLAKIEEVEDQIISDISKCIKLGIPKAQINQFLSATLFNS